MLLSLWELDSKNISSKDASKCTLIKISTYNKTDFMFEM